MMEDVQLSNILNPSSINTSEPSNEFIKAEGPEMATNAPSAIEGDASPILQPPSTTAEVVIEKKVELELEDPILPDHYYDNGNVPVFKPVSSS